MHGINFGCRCEYCSKAELPPAIARRFAKRIKPKGYNLKRHDWFYLKGVAQNEHEMVEMERAAKNGNRQTYIVPRSTAAGMWYGIYVH